MNNILLVEENRNSSSLLSQILTDHGFSVSALTSGQEALAYCQHTMPNLVISSVNTSDINGFKLCAEVRTQDKLLPVMLMSSQKDLEHYTQGFRFGADDYLIKPFEPKEFIAKVESQIHRAQKIKAEVLRISQQANPLANPSESSQQPQKLDYSLLTPSEKKVFYRTLTDSTVKETAAFLFLSTRTVQSHLSSIYKKFKIKSRYQLLWMALENGF